MILNAPMYLYVLLSLYNYFRFCFTVLTKTRKDLKRSTTTFNEQKTTWNDLQRSTMSKKRPETTYNKQETAWNNPQRVRHNLQWPEHSYNEQRKDAKRPTARRFSGYFTIWGKRFSSLSCVKRQLPCVFFTGYKIYFFLSRFRVSRERERLYFLAPLYHFQLLRKIVGPSAFAFNGEV